MTLPKGQLVREIDEALSLCGIALKRLAGAKAGQSVTSQYFLVPSG
jgi:hypothetical protein